MKDTRRGGLSGKARDTRRRGTTARWQSDQQIADFFEPGQLDALRQRCIPIKRRGDFLPTASVPNAQVREVQGDQMELPLRGKHWSAELCQDLRPPTTHQKRRQAAGAIRFWPRAVRSVRGIFDGKKSETPKRNSASLPSRRTRNPVSDTPAWAGGEAIDRGAFTVRGFLSGCAIGSVAAAAFLVCISFVV